MFHLRPQMIDLNDQSNEIYLTTNPPKTKSPKNSPKFEKIANSLYFT